MRKIQNTELKDEAVRPMGYTAVIIVTLIAFFSLAALLLVPVYRFLEREEEASKRWTKEQLAQRLGDESLSRGE